MRFADRREAGRALAASLLEYAGGGVVVLGLPRGGVPVAAEVALALDAPLDVLVVRKLGFPGQPELAMGAIAAVGDALELVRNESVLDRSAISALAFNAVYERELRALQAREASYRGGARGKEVRGRVVIIVDDGLATGSTMRAAIAAVRKQAPARIVAAVPVGAQNTCVALSNVADQVVCPLRPEPFFAVSEGYANFAATSDEDVTRIIGETSHRTSKGPRHMQAVGIREFGGPEALEVIDLPERHPGPEEVRVRVHAATVNPTDTYIRNGALAPRLAAGGPPPYVPGMDVAGVVDEVGQGVTELSVGDPVMAMVQPSGPHGGYSSSLVLPVRSVVRAPAGASYAEASTLPMNGLTARLTLDLLALSPGQTLAVTGAAGAYGGYVVQLAKADGLSVVADASEVDRPLVAALGADLVLPRADAFAGAVRAEFPSGVDALADGAVQGEPVFAAVRDGGAVAVVRGWRGIPPRGLTVHDVWVHDYVRAREKLDRLREQVEQGQITLRVAQTYPPQQAGEAHRRLEAGGTRGRLVIEFD